MPMLVLQRLVLVFALMCFRQVQVQPDRDQDTRTDHPGGDRLVEHADCQQRADERAVEKALSYWRARC